MKKFILTACFALGAALSVDANSLTIVNITSCTIYGITQGGMITVPAASNASYGSPANVSNPSAPPSGTFTGVTYDITPSFTNPVFVSAANPNCAALTPDCSGASYFCYNWNVNPTTGNITLIFF
jgi:hypothetical protein